MVRFYEKLDGGYQPQHGQGGCPDAHQVQVLAQNIGMGDGCPSALIGDWQSGWYSAQGDQGCPIACGQARISIGGYRDITVYLPLKISPEISRIWWLGLLVVTGEVRISKSMTRARLVKGKPNENLKTSLVACPSLVTCLSLVVCPSLVMCLSSVMCRSPSHPMSESEFSHE